MLYFCYITFYLLLWQFSKSSQFINHKKQLNLRKLDRNQNVIALMEDKKREILYNSSGGW